MIKVLICDGDGTLQLPYPSASIRTLLQTCNDLDIRIAVASNSQSSAKVAQVFKAAGQAEPITFTRSQIGKPKPAPEFVYRIRDAAKVELNEMLFLGDHDNDALCAINITTRDRMTTRD